MSKKLFQQHPLINIQNILYSFSFKKKIVVSGSFRHFSSYLVRIDDCYNKGGSRQTTYPQPVPTKTKSTKTWHILNIKLQN